MRFAGVKPCPSPVPPARGGGFHPFLSVPGDGPDLRGALPGGRVGLL